MATSSDVLALETRKQIYETVRKSPGSHLREIQRSTGLSFGSVSYHLAYLCRHEMIKEEKDGKNNRYFPIEMDSSDKKMLGLLRQKSIRGILLFSLLHNEFNHQALVSQLKLSPSTISWHLKTLESVQVIKSSSANKRKKYQLNIDKSTIIKLLIAYKESFLDSMVNSVVELVDVRYR